jgi:hypothetical protein
MTNPDTPRTGTADLITAESCRRGRALAAQEPAFVLPAPGSAMQEPDPILPAPGASLSERAFAGDEDAGLAIAIAALLEELWAAANRAQAALDAHRAAAEPRTADTEAA